jgi:hypothetical protein
MPKEKFNPIAELPLLPGAEIADDEKQTNIIDSTYPPIEHPDKDSEKLLIGNLLKNDAGVTLNKLDTKKESSRHLVIVRATILACLIAVVIFGIFLTLKFVPKIAGNMSNFSQSFSSLIVPNKTIGPVSTSTPNQIPAYIPPTATSTTKTPAKLAVNILSTNIINNRTTVVFNVQNIGGTTSGIWSFSATLPSNATPKYYSVVQNALTPQSGVIYTLEFTADQYTNTPIQITIYN